MPRKTVKNLTYNLPQSDVDGAVWHRTHRSDVAAPARAVLRQSHGLTLRADDGAAPDPAPAGSALTPARPLHQP